MYPFMALRLFAFITFLCTSGISQTWWSLRCIFIPQPLYMVMWLGNRRSHAHGIIDGGGRSGLRV